MPLAFRYRRASSPSSSLPYRIRVPLAKLQAKAEPLNAKLVAARQPELVREEIIAANLYTGPVRAAPSPTPTSKTPGGDSHAPPPPVLPPIAHTHATNAAWLAFWQTNRGARGFECGIGVGRHKRVKYRRIGR